MNKWTKIALAAVAVMMLGALTLTPSFAQERPSDDDTPGVEERIRNFARNNFGRWHRRAHEGHRGEKAEVVAEALGITVEELQTAREEGKSMDDLLAEQGLDQETFEANLKVAAIARINQKVADGDLTQERADAMIERIESGDFNMKGRGHGKGHGKGHGHRHGRGMAAKADVVAEALGVTVEDLQAAREEGKTLADLIAEQGLDEETFQANLKTAAIAQVNQLLADGTITQEKADKWIEKIESAEFNLNGRGFGRGFGNRGNRGGERGGDDNPGNTEESDTDGNAGGDEGLFRLTALGQSGEMSLFLPVVTAAGQ